MSKPVYLAGLSVGVIAYLAAFHALLLSGLWAVFGGLKWVWLLAAGLSGLAASCGLILVCAKKLRVSHVLAPLLGSTTKYVALILGVMLVLFFVLCAWLENMLGGGLLT